MNKSRLNEKDTKMINKHAQRLLKVNVQDKQILEKKKAAHSKELFFFF